ncbi:hypothetical protein M9Y10_013868 [Tritrichomonas musculus]|uniref:Uncharacterized protein n=1 Tax=Tritrichomonas musculus TaxID=1915356 RepID=A0ABR2KZY2_9EUKA
MNVNIIEPIKNHLKEFNTIDEFNAFYSLHKDEMDALTTHKLNKMYFLKGYCITKIKGVLMLKKWDTSNKNEDEEKMKEEINNASTKAKEVDEYVRNDLSKKVENLSSYQQQIEHIYDEIKKLQLENTSFKIQIEKIKAINEKEIDDLKDDFKKIKGTISDIIDFCNNKLK